MVIVGGDNRGNASTIIDQSEATIVIAGGDGHVVVSIVQIEEHGAEEGEREEAFNGKGCGERESGLLNNLLHHQFVILNGVR